MSEVTYRQMKLLFINVFGILYRAVMLNIFRLYADLREAKMTINLSKQEVWIRELFILLISGLIVLRFILCFLVLASNIIAIYPIMTGSQGELLMPALVVHFIDNILINIYEVLLGYCARTYLIPITWGGFGLFLGKMLIKTGFSISALNIYSDEHHRLCSMEESHNVMHDDDDEINSEVIIARLDLS